MIREFAYFIEKQIHDLTEKKFGSKPPNIFLFLQFHLLQTIAKNPACHNEKICVLKLNFMALIKKLEKVSWQSRLLLKFPARKY